MSYARRKLVQAALRPEVPVLFVDDDVSPARVQQSIRDHALVCAGAMTPESLSQLHAKIGSPPFAVPASTDRILFYGLRQHPHGWERLIEYEATITVHEDPIEAPDDWTEPGKTAATVLEGEHEDPDAAFLRWVEPLPPSRLLGAGATDLSKLAHSYTDRIYSQATMDTQWGKGPFLLQANVFAVACSVSASNQNGDYYWLESKCLFAPPTDDWVLIRSYTVDAAPLDICADATVAGILSSDPQTTVGSTTTSSSSSSTLGGNIGFFGDTATGGISGSVTVGSSSSFSTPAVVTRNQSGTQGNNTKWEFDVDFQSPMVRATFQPDVQSIWRVDVDAAAQRGGYSSFRVATTISGTYRATAHVHHSPFGGKASWTEATASIDGHVTEIVRPPSFTPAS